uniref:Uncharacterized protein n=1 Tax=Meloidogyne enterolobii TaxID=390850 RepID=A0A6V7XNF5_MELEN|nr:unnamed protein product [Meloidogyne enterolobii]
MSLMKKHLIKQNIDELIRQADFLSDQLKSTYANLTEMILQDKQIVVRLFESNPTLHIASITPQALVYFIEEFNAERRSRADEFHEAENELHSEISYSANPTRWYEFTALKNKNEQILKQYDNIYDKLQKKWAKALFDYTLSARHLEKFKRQEFVIDGHEDEHVGSSSTSYKVEEIARKPKQVLYFDPHSANTSTFYVAIYGIENPAKEINGTHGSAIIAAIGDANTSAHFMTSSGTSTGKFSKMFVRF